MQTTEARRRTFPALLWHLDRLHVSRQQSSERNEQGIEARQRTDDGRHIESAMGFEKGKVLQMLGTWNTDASTAERGIEGMCISNERLRALERDPYSKHQPA